MIVRARFASSAIRPKMRAGAAERLGRGDAMKAASVFLVAAIMATASAAPCRADPPLAGQYLIGASPGQPFCSSPRELAAYTLATIQHDAFAFNAFPGCVTVNRGTPIQVTQDLGPRGHAMHVVKARASLSFPFRSIDAYTYSAGLYRLYYNPLVEQFRAFP